MFRRSFLLALLAPLAAPFVRLPSPKGPESLNDLIQSTKPEDCICLTAGTYNLDTTVFVHGITICREGIDQTAWIVTSPPKVAEERI